VLGASILSRRGLRILLLLAVVVIVLSLRRVKPPVALISLVAVVVALLPHVVELLVRVLEMRLLDGGGRIVIIHVVWGVLHWVLPAVLLLLLHVRIASVLSVHTTV
jgi:hypothetical protein